MENLTIQIRIDRKLHKLLKYKALESEETITKLATDLISKGLANNNNILKNAINREEIQNNPTELSTNE
jgi:hypothetical protein